MMNWKFAFATFLVLKLAACGGGGAGPTPTPTTYTISGTVTGLESGRETVLLNNSGNATTISKNGSFSFSTPVIQGGGYAVTIGTQPNGQTCTVINAAGAGVVANISNVTVVCSNMTYAISGTVSGLNAGNKVTLLNNLNNPTIVSNNGSFGFNVPISQYGNYSITVGVQPNGQTCTVSNGAGAGVVTNINSVSVNCSSITYPLFGTVSGLASGKQVTLLNNSGDPTTVTNNGTFGFNTQVTHNGSYSINVGTQPNGQICSVSNGTGSSIVSSVFNIQVVCTSTTAPLLTKIGANGSYAKSVVIQPDGKLVVAGVSLASNQDKDIALVRYNSNGGLDTSFGVAGVVTTNIFGRVASTDWAESVGIQSDGKILVVGSAIKSGDSGQNLMLLRYNSDGSLDSSFAESGVAKILNSAKDTIGSVLAIQPDGKIIVAGSVNCVGRSTPGFCTLLQRFTKDGAVDVTFNGPGVNRSDSSTTGVRGLVLLNDGKILIAGTKDNGNGEELSVARYMPDGLIDSSFGNFGVATVGIGSEAGSYNNGTGIALQADGKILASGVAHTNSANNHFSLTRLTTNGRVDTSFGRLGSVVTNVAIPPQSDRSYSVVVQPDGKILVAGENTIERTNPYPYPGFFMQTNVNFALVRYNTNGTLDTSFGTNGIVTTDVNQLDDRAYAMAIQPDGFIVLVGESFTYDPTGYLGSYRSFGTVRYRPDGTVDTNFGPAN